METTTIENSVSFIDNAKFTQEQLFAKIKRSNPQARLIQYPSELMNFKQTSVHIETEETPQPKFSAQFESISEPDNLQDFLKNFYISKQNEIHVIINSGRSNLRTQEFFERELDKIKLSIEPNFNVELKPNILLIEEGQEPKELTCIQISIPFEGDVKNWKYVNLLEIVPKNKNIKMICQFNQTESKLFNAEIVVDSNHIEYAMKKLKSRIFNEEKRINQEYQTFLNFAFSEIDKQFKKSELIHQSLFSIKK